MKLEKYRNFLHHHDWNYHTTDDTFRWISWQTNAEYFLELSKISARHRCLYSSYLRKSILSNNNKFKD